MTFFDMLHAHFELNQMLELALRIVVAAVCGGIVGIERSRRLKDAGVRTHCMVACTAAILMIISKYGFADLVSEAGVTFAGTRTTDPARIAAQIVSGISFLGVGIIYRDRQHAVKGLTTAAGIWAVAGVGMAIGAGMYYLGIFSMLFVVLLQFITHRIVIGNDKYTDARISTTLQGDSETVKSIEKDLEALGVIITDASVSKESGLIRYEIDVKVPSKDTEKKIMDRLLGDSSVNSVKMSDMA